MRTYKGDPIGRHETDAEKRRRYQKLFPGVPAEQIAIPRYYAKDSDTFASLNNHKNHPETWKLLVEFDLDLMIQACEYTSDLGGPDKTLEARARRIALKKLRHALQWWKSIRPRTVFNVHQDLYTRNDRWKDVVDYPEFLACWTVCCVWQNLPKWRCGPRDVESKSKELWRLALLAYDQRHANPTPLKPPARKVK